MTTPMAPTQIAELRRLLSEASPRPWEPRTVEDWTRETISGAGPGHSDYPQENDPEDTPPYRDAALIAAAVNALPGLLDRPEELERQLADANAHIATLEREMADD